MYYWVGQNTSAVISRDNASRLSYGRGGAVMFVGSERVVSALAKEMPCVGWPAPAMMLK
jgi:hypothetical protein